jgi:hypothetical protein
VQPPRSAFANRESIQAAQAAESDDAVDVANGNGATHELRPARIGIRIRLGEPLAECRIVITLPPSWHRAIERLLNAGVLRALGCLPQLLIFSPKLSQRGLEGIGGSTPGEVDELTAVIVEVLLR